MEKKLEVLAPSKEALTAPAKDPESILRFAIEHGASVETIERIMAVRRELKAEQAKAEFDMAMASFQSKCPVIIKSKAGAKNYYRYAPLDDIVQQVRGLIKEHGFSYKITTDIDTGWVKAVCTVTHAAGHSETSEFKVPIDSKENAMSDPQRYAGAMTFAKRYAVCNSFGILTADEDTDAAAKPKPAGPSTVASAPSVKDLARELWKLLEPVRGKEMNWNAANQFLWDEGIIDDTEAAPDFTADRFKLVITKTKAKLDARKS